MLKSRITSGALVLLPVTVAFSLVMFTLSGCGGTSTSGFAPLPELQQQQLGGVVTTLNQITSGFTLTNQYGSNSSGTTQQLNCPQVNNISAGVVELDYGSGCQPPQGGPTMSGKIIISQSPTGGDIEVTFIDYNAGNGFVVTGSIVYTLDPNGGYTVAMNLSQTPASGTLQACSVQFQFNGTYTPTSNGYILNGTGIQTTTVNNNTISYQITYNNVTSGSGCGYPTSGTVTVQQMAPTGAPIGQPVTITYTNQCGVVQMNTGSNTFTANLQNFNAPNPCQGAPRI